MAAKAAWTRQHGSILATVFRHGDDDFSAVAMRSDENRGTQQGISSLDAAKRAADQQTQQLWAHDCTEERCGVWEPSTGESE